MVKHKKIIFASKYKCRYLFFLVGGLERGWEDGKNLEVEGEKYLKTLRDNYQDFSQNFLNFMKPLYKLGASLGWFFECKFCLQSIHFLTKISENVGINNITDSSSRNHFKFCFNNKRYFVLPPYPSTVWVKAVYYAQ